MEETNHLEHLSRLQDVRQWQPWSRTLAEVADNLGVDPSRGLDHLEAFNRLGHFGPNIPVELSHNLGFFRVLAEEITEPMMLLLLSVGVLYSIWGEGWDAAAIFIAITLVIGLEVLTEWRAKTTLASLLNSVPTNTSVLRDGRERVVSAEDLVPGDVLILSHGQSVPADAVVAVCHGFSVDESLLTGESVNVYKAALGSFESSAEHGNSTAGSDELQEMPPSYVCAGTTVASGRAVCVVVATGPHTEIAANIVQLMKGSRPPPTPLQRRMKKLAGSLSAIAIAICILITLVGLLKGMDWREAILMGMSLAFATIPEELPLIAKASLALGARQLARYKLLVRRLSAADALSSVSVIVTDKTGTLTRNQLIVSSILAISSDSTDAESLSVEVITPEATASSEKSAAIAAPLYAAWSLSVDPLEAKPLAQFLESIRVKATGRPHRSPSLDPMASPRIQGSSRLSAGKSVSPTTGASVPRPLHGSGKDFMNSAVLQSLPDFAEGGSSDAYLLRDPDTDSIPLLRITESISLVCERLPEPTGELPFDPALRISAKTRSPPAVPVSYAAAAAPVPQTYSPASSKQKHWTVLKGAPETLLPMCDRVWNTSAASSIPVSADTINSGNIDGIQEMTEAFAQTISRSATNLAVGGNRIIAYAIAITDEPLFSARAAPGAADNDGKAAHEPDPHESAATDAQHTWRSGESHAFRFRDGNEASASATMTAAAAAAQLPEGSATLDPRGKGLKPVLPTNLIFVGAFAFFDPPQGEARPVLQECQDAGIRVIVASGDHPSTTLAVANAVGITEGHHGSINPSAVAHRLRRIISRGTYDAIGGLHSVRSPTAPTPSEIHAVTGEMIQKSLTNGTFDQLIDESNVFARVTPAQKLRLVHSLQARGEVVAFVGDGVNDSPALTRADVGICMGGNASTADVAMDSASLVILSGKFSGVVRSLREGHRLAANIDKCLVFYIACKIALVSLFAFLLLAEGVSPLTPVQVILIEMFTDLGATWTFLTERPEGIPSSCNESEASLKALGLVRGAVGGSDRSDTSGYLGFGKAADRAVAFYGFLLFAACAFPLVIPSILLPSWAVAPVAPTMTFLTWMAAHSLLGFSMRTRIVPLRVHDRHSLSSPSALASAPAAASRSLGLQPQQAVLEQQQLLTQSNKTLRSRVNVPGVVWVASSLLTVILAATIPPVSGYLGVIRLDAVEWVMVIVSPLLLIGFLEVSKEVKFSRFRRRHHIRFSSSDDDSAAALDGERRPLIST